MDRRLFSLLLVASLFTGSHAAGAQSLNTELVASGFSSALYVTSPPGDFDRLFVVEQCGLIKIIKNGATLGSPFLDVTALVTAVCFGEQGLLGLAFHRDFVSNGRFFVNYTDDTGDTNVVEYVVDGGPPLSTDVANSNPVQTIFFQDQSDTNHNGGNLQFGGDGKLYIGMGDSFSGANSQAGTTNLGKMIRLDVDIPSPFIPPDNPFVGVAGTNDAIWAFGLRNPWRYSFDRATGDLWIGDVGSQTRGEIDFEAAGNGGNNYGWPCMEGFYCANGGAACCGSPSYTLPVLDYTHSAGTSHAVIGGYVYRGSAIPSSQGLYFYADYGSGRVWSYNPASGAIIDRTAELGTIVGSFIRSFGEDASGEVYIVDGYRVVKIIENCAGGSVSNYCIVSPNSDGPGAVISSNGSWSLADNTFTLAVSGAPGGQFGLFFYGDQQTQNPFGDGVLCVGLGGSGIHRLNPPTLTSSAGNSMRPVDFTVPPADFGPGMIVPGTTWNFQFWFRDPGGPGGTNFNLSDGLAALFCP